MPKKKNEEPKIMTPIEGKILGIKNRQFQHGDQIPPVFAEKFADKLMVEWTPPAEKPETKIAKIAKLGVEQIHDPSD